MQERWSPRLYQKILRCACGEGCTVHCWLWQGLRDQAGYGRTKTVVYGRPEVYIHRIAWALAHGRAARKEVCHTCDNPPCCNPSHLWEGTHKQNHQDSTRKGRRACGASIARPKKLTAAQVQAIRQLYAGSTLLLREIAAQFGVSQPMISHILDRRAWAHVPDGDAPLTVAVSRRWAD